MLSTPEKHSGHTRVERRWARLSRSAHTLRVSGAAASVFLVVAAIIAVIQLAVRGRFALIEDPSWTPFALTSIAVFLCGTAAFSPRLRRLAVAPQLLAAAVLAGLATLTSVVFWSSIATAIYSCPVAGGCPGTLEMIWWGTAIFVPPAAALGLLSYGLAWAATGILPRMATPPAVEEPSPEKRQQPRHFRPRPGEVAAPRLPASAEHPVELFDDEVRALR